MIASVSAIPVKVIKVLLPAYHIPDPLPWAEIVGPLAAAEDALARLDERLAKSPIRDGWIARTHFADACASLWVDGELVHLDDLVLHDSHMDIRTPTHELTLAHAVLRARRRIADAEPGWALSPAGLSGLRGRGKPRGGPLEATTSAEGIDMPGEGGDDGLEDQPGEPAPVVEADHRLADALAAVDAAIANADRTLTDKGIRDRSSERDRDPLLYDPDWDEGGRLDRWRAIVNQARALPPTLAAAVALDAWDMLTPLEHAHWLGRLLAAAVLRERGKARRHLPCIHVGLKLVPRERRRALAAPVRLAAHLEALGAAGEAGLKDHDRWVNARNLLARKLDGRRSTSRLPDLLDYVLTRPVVSAGMIAKELKITPRAAQDLVAQLGLREATGRDRYRAWAIL
ncbi:RHE_PE00001 family protein [Rhodopseudomonas parapalustris]